MTSETLISTRIVRSYELDSFGHVNNAVYLQYCEGARNDYMQQKGIEFADFHRWQIGPVLYRANLDYRQPAFADDVLQIAGSIEFNGRIRFTIHHEVTRQSDRAQLCQATLDFAFVNLTTQKPCRAPNAFVAAFTPVTGSCATS